MANFTALAIARNVKAGYNIREEGITPEVANKMVVYGSTEVHSRITSYNVCYTKLLRSELNASKVPTCLNSRCSTSLKAGFVTILPFSTYRAGRVYSSMTSIGENGAL